MKKILLALWLLALGLLALGDDGEPAQRPDTRVEARLEPATGAVTGQPLRLVVDIWVTTWFLSAPELPPLQLPNALVTLADDAQHISDERDGVRWFGIERVYSIVPMRPGEIRIPALSIVVHPGPDGAAVTAQTAPLTLRVSGAALAGGAGNSLVTTHLALKQDFDRPLDHLKVGDSFTRTVTQTADNTPAMLLPPIPFPAIDGFQVYPAPPRVDNLVDERSGAHSGRRIDTATYVAQRAGRYDLAALRVDWWNPQARGLRTATVPTVHIEVARAPAASVEFALPGDARPLARARAAFYALVAAACSGALWFLTPLLRRSWSRLRALYALECLRFENSEYHAYNCLRRALRRNDAAASYRALYFWAARIGRLDDLAGPAAFAARIDDAPLRAAVAKLEARFYAAAPATTPWSGAELLRICARVRQSLRAAARSSSSLPPLNPQPRAGR